MPDSIPRGKNPDLPQYASAIAGLGPTHPICCSPCQARALRPVRPSGGAPVLWDAKPLAFCNGMRGQQLPASLNGAKYATARTLVLVHRKQPIAVINTGQHTDPIENTLISILMIIVERLASYVCYVFFPFVYRKSVSSRHSLRTMAASGLMSAYA